MARDSTTPSGLPALAVALAHADFRTAGGLGLTIAQVVLQQAAELIQQTPRGAYRVKLLVAEALVGPGASNRPLQLQSPIAGAQAHRLSGGE